MRVQIRTDPSLEFNAEDYIPIVTSMLQVQIPLLEWPGDTERHRETCGAMQTCSGPIRPIILCAVLICCIKVLIEL